MLARVVTMTYTRREITALEGSRNQRGWHARVASASARWAFTTRCRLSYSTRKGGSSASSSLHPPL